MLYCLTFPSRWFSGAASALALTLAVVACGDPDAPVVNSVEPEFAPPDSLVVVQGQNLEGITAMRFDGQIVNFNTSYNADQALLFRVPRNLMPADYTVTLETDGGVATFPFRVSEKAPRILGTLEPQGALGGVVTIVGENFFEPPLEVYFSTGLDENDMPLDSVIGEVISFSEDTVRARIPPEARSGNFFVRANGGIARSPTPFRIVESTLLTDFDGGGVRGDVTTYRAFGRSLDQGRDLDALIAEHESPPPFDGRYLKMSGVSSTRPASSGVRIPDSGDPLGFEGLPLDVLLGFRVNHGGAEGTQLRVGLVDADGLDYALPGGFVTLEEDGWTRVSIPFNQFTDTGGLPIDPANLRGVVFSFRNTDAEPGTRYEANIDNITVSRIL